MSLTLPPHKRHRNQPSLEDVTLAISAAIPGNFGYVDEYSDLYYNDDPTAEVRVSVTLARDPAETRFYFLVRIHYPGAPSEGVPVSAAFPQIQGLQWAGKMGKDMKQIVKTYVWNANDYVDYEDFVAGMAI